MDDNHTDTAVDPAAASEPAPAPATADAARLQRERDEYYDLLLRKTAEFDNYRKRIERDRQASAEANAADLVKDLLPLVDDLERALKAEAGADGAATYRKGVELIQKRLDDILRRRVIDLEAERSFVDHVEGQARLDKLGDGSARQITLGESGEFLN